MSRVMVVMVLFTPVHSCLLAVAAKPEISASESILGCAAAAAKQQSGEQQW